MSAAKIKKGTDPSSQKPEVVVKKVKAYPISVQILKEGQPPLLAKIIKLTEVGFLMKVIGQKIFKVGDNYQVEFDVPTTDKTIKQPVKVIKTYDNFDTHHQQGLEKVYTIEMHFRTLSDGDKEAIGYFIKEIGQK